MFEYWTHYCIIMHATPFSNPFLQHMCINILLSVLMPTDAVLFCASQYGHISIVEILLSKGSNINGTDAYGGTPLILASFHGKVNVVSRLLEAGSHFDVRKYFLFGMRFQVQAT